MNIKFPPQIFFSNTTVLTDVVVALAGFFALIIPICSIIFKRSAFPIVVFFTRIKATFRMPIAVARMRTKSTSRYLLFSYFYSTIFTIHFIRNKTTSTFTRAIFHFLTSWSRKQFSALTTYKSCNSSTVLVHSLRPSHKKRPYWQSVLLSRQYGPTEARLNKNSDLPYCLDKSIITQEATCSNILAVDLS